MLSEETEAQLLELFNVQNSYQPNAEITAQLAQKTIIMMVGATGVGKSTIMHEIVRLDPRFGFAGTFTSRPRRADDNPDIYTYYKNTDAGLAELLQHITNHEVVQYAVNPFSKLIYGTELSDYPQQFNLRDVFAGAVAGFEQLGFGSAHAISVVTEPETWLKRFEERFPVGHVERLARRNEAISSLKWSLSHPRGCHSIIENVSGKPEIAAQAVIRTVLGAAPHDDARARELCERCLAAAEGVTI